MNSLKEKLAERMKSEMRAFVASLDASASNLSEILDDFAYEYTIKAEFISEIENGSVSNETMSALYKDKKPLNTLYDEWLNNEFTMIDMINDTITDCGDKLLQQNKGKNLWRNDAR